MLHFPLPCLCDLLVLILLVPNLSDLIDQCGNWGGVEMLVAMEVFVGEGYHAKIPLKNHLLWLLNIFHLINPLNIAWSCICTHLTNLLLALYQWMNDFIPPVISGERPLLFFGALLDRQLQQTVLFASVERAYNTSTCFWVHQSYSSKTIHFLDISPILALPLSENI